MPLPIWAGQQILLSGLSGLAVISLDLSPLCTPDIQTVTRSDNTFALSWSALMGRAYQVQFKTDLTQTNWSNLILRLTATNTTMTTFDPVASDAQRFYRVALLP
jgi:uncharacterized surface anchored protein